MGLFGNRRVNVTLGKNITLSTALQNDGDYRSQVARAAREQGFAGTLYFLLDTVKIEDELPDNEVIYSIGVSRRAKIGALPLTI